MIEIDSTITITAVIAICSIVSPVLTVCLNNFHDQKMKKIEFKHSLEEKTLFYRRGVYEDYLKITGKLLVDSSTHTRAEYGEIYPLALLYFPSNLTPVLIKINSLINNRTKYDALPLFENLANDIRAILK